MTSRIRVSTLLVLGLPLVGSSHATGLAAQEEKLELPGLQSSVEIVTDRWGINHIYADNESDLLNLKTF